MEIAQTLSSVTLVALIGAGIVYTTRTDADATVPTVQELPSPRVRTATAEAAPPYEHHTYFARVEPASRFMMASTQGGRVLERVVNIGDTVAEGDVIATLDPAAWRNALAANQANRRSIATQLEQLERDAERARRLISAELGTDSTLESIESGIAATRSQLAALDAQIDEARRQVRESTVRATAAGVVTDVFVEGGEVVAAGTPIVALSTDENVELHFDVPESAISRLQVGDELQVHFPISGLAQRTATVTQISRAGSATGRLFPVRARLSDEQGVAPSMSAEVVASLPAAAGVAVPVRSLVGPAGADVSVWRVEDNRVQPVRVTPVRVDGDRVVVHADELHAGDDVVTAGLRRLSAGAEIVIAAPASTAGGTNE